MCRFEFQFHLLVGRTCRSEDHESLMEENNHLVDCFFLKFGSKCLHMLLKLCNGKLHVHLHINHRCIYIYVYISYIMYCISYSHQYYVYIYINKQKYICMIMYVYIQTRSMLKQAIRKHIKTLATILCE